MTIKSILCIFGGSQNELNAVNTALLLGKANGAHVRFLHISPNPTSYTGVYGEGIVAIAAVMEALEKENAIRMQQARQYVTSLAAKHHVPLDTPESPAHRVSAQFVHLTGFLEHEIAREGRLSDLVIIGRDMDGLDASYEFIMTAALFNTGRPVIVMPIAKGEMADWQDKIIAVAWKGTREASQAIYNAMPFLEKAEKVYVLTAEGHREGYNLAAEAAMMQYLRAHGIHAQGIVVAAGTRTPGEALLARAKELKADLLVMGAYGHSRFREMLLGGVTNHMLEKADIPLFLSH